MFYALVSDEDCIWFAEKNQGIVRDAEVGFRVQDWDIREGIFSSSHPRVSRESYFSTAGAKISQSVRKGRLFRFRCEIENQGSWHNFVSRACLQKRHDSGLTTHEAKI
jgi:hypothetical protein